MWQCQSRCVRRMSMSCYRQCSVSKQWVIVVILLLLMMTLLHSMLLACWWLVLGRQQAGNTPKTARPKGHSLTWGPKSPQMRCQRPRVGLGFSGSLSKLPPRNPPVRESGGACCNLPSTVWGRAPTANTFWSIQRAVNASGGRRYWEFRGKSFPWANLDTSCVHFSPHL